MSSQLSRLLTGPAAALAAFCLAFSLIATAAEPLEFNDPAMEVRYQKLTEELRCLVCQNQNLADSDAPLAQDLRQEIFEMLQAGRTDAEIKTFLVDRYGDFVLYRPAFEGNTLFLWLLPSLLLVIGLIVLIVNVRRRSRLPAPAEEESRD